MNSPDLKLMVGNTEYRGWKSTDINLGMEQCANGFELETSELWPGQSTPVPITQDDKCTLIIDGETVITGWVDDVVPEYVSTNKRIAIKGRDVTGDLVDCSVQARSWNNAGILTIARDMCGPFSSIKVALQDGVDPGKPFLTFRANTGDKVFDVLDRAARQRGLLIYSDGLGHLVFGHAGTKSYDGELVGGQNILGGNATSSYCDRFSSYTFVAQPPLDDAGGITPEIAAKMQATATDPNVRRYRPMVKLATDWSDIATLKDRAKWEATVQAARASRARIMVQGWRNGEELWRPNRLVKITDPVLKLDGTYLITSVRLRLDVKEGQRAELGITPPSAFSRLPIPAKDDLSVLG